MTVRRGRARRHLIVGTALLLGAPLTVVGAVSAGAASLPPDAAPSAVATNDIPPDLLALYQQAANACPGLPWPVLAGIGKVESDHNRPAGQVSAVGAQGPMQFLPGTWAQYGVDGNGDGRTDPNDPADAVPAAADYLCAHGATRDVPLAVASYFCGDLAFCQFRAEQPGGYAARVLDWADQYADPTRPGGPRAASAVQIALAAVGTPYLWGGENPDTGFDCSGLVQSAYGRDGVQLPRTAQAQYDAGPVLPAGDSLQPGDLVFFGRSLTQISHVGIALGDGRMVDAPHTGADVRVEPVAGFGDYVGATRPADGAGR